MDGGAYVTLSPVVLSRGTLHATGPYECPNVRIRSRAVADEHAAERRLPRLRRAADAVRRRDADGAARRRGSGSTRSRSAAATRSGRARRCRWARRCARASARAGVLETCVEAERLRAARRASARAGTAAASKPSWRGIGLALVHHGAGFTGSGEALPEQPRRRHARRARASSACSRARPSSARARRHSSARSSPRRSACRSSS